MLQTLVENAIKHGISKQINGGVVRVISVFKDEFHELAVQNTGNLNGSINGESRRKEIAGFGISSTTDRISLLYGNKAKFEISNQRLHWWKPKCQYPLKMRFVKNNSHESNYY